MNLLEIIWVAIPVVFAITVHEVAHGWTARRLGDPTAASLGRLTLNPIRHIDPIGTVLVPALMYWLGGFLFGWARPVPVNWRNLRHPRRDMALVAAAGPMSNLLMLLGWALIFAVGIRMPNGQAGAALISMGEAGIMVNTVLMVLNLLPVPPLDGSRVLTALLPARYAAAFNRLEPYGLMIVVLLLASGVLGQLIGPPIRYIAHWAGRTALGII